MSYRFYQKAFVAIGVCFLYMCGVICMGVVEDMKLGEGVRVGGWVGGADLSWTIRLLHSLTLS